MHKNSLFLRIYRENVFLFCVPFFPPLTQSPLCSTAIPGYYISFSMLLDQTMTSAHANCFQTRSGLSFHFIFRFFAQVPVAAKADNEKRCMMSCRQSIQRQNVVTTSFQEVILSPAVSFAVFPSTLSFFILFAMGKPKFFSPSDNIQVLYLWELPDKEVCV